MRAPSPFLLAGVLWGLVLGLGAGYAASAAMAGFAWLYLFGDSPWPAWANGLVLGTGVAVALAVLLAGVGAGARLARRAQIASLHPAASAPPPAQRRRAWLAVLAGLAALLVGLAVLALAAQRDERARARAAAGAAAYETLRRDGQRIVEVAGETASAAGRLDVALVTEGRRGGRHRLTWVLLASAYDAVLVQGLRETWLAPGANTLRLELDATTVIGAYHEMALGGDPMNVEVEEMLKLELVLTPLLNDEALAALPAARRQNLEIEQSDLTDRRTVRLPLRFAIRPGEYRLLE